MGPLESSSSTVLLRVTAPELVYEMPAQGLHLCYRHLGHLSF